MKGRFFFFATPKHSSIYASVSPRGFSVKTALLFLSANII